MKSISRIMLVTTVAALAMNSMLASVRADGDPSAAQRVTADDRQTLQQRFKDRYPAILNAKKSGSVGETSQGVLEAVKLTDDATLKQLIADENNDRAALYALIAKDEDISPDQVARRAAKRNFDHARSGEWLKTDGEWRQK